MQFQIITFGNGEILKGVLDAVVMCIHSETGTLYAPLLRIGMIFGVFWAAIYSIWGDFLKVWGRATLPFIFIPPLLFIPSATVNIYDPVTNFRENVDRVPYGLAYVSHFVSQIGFEITKQVDMVFSNVDDLKYHKSGFLMASNMIQQARTFRITNEEVASSLREFVCQCVAYEAMLGYKYTFEDLRHSSDIWGLVSERPSKIRSFVWKSPRDNEERKEARANVSEIISCQEGVQRFNQLWAPELNRTTKGLGTKLFGHVNPLRARQEFLKYLPLSYEFLSGISKNADQILKQQMMIHAVVDGIEQKSVSLGNAPNFAARRAYLQQRATYETLGAMASESLLTMKAVLEAIVYASFIFLVPLAILPFGIKILLSWLQTLLWLQMWAPLYAILNFMMSKTAQARSIGMLSISNSDGVTIASSAGLMNLNADISAMAGFLAMSVPFLAIALVKGVGSFVHMASHLGNVPQGAASQAAADAVSGNYSFGNVSTGNEQIANTNMLSQSRAASYRAGAFQLIDGRMDMTTMADGEQVVNIGTSNLPVSVNQTQTDSNQLSEMATKSRQKGLTLSKSSAKHVTESCRDLVDLSEALSQSESIGDGASMGQNAEHAKAVHKAAQLIKGFDNEKRMGLDKSSNLSGGVGSGTRGGGGHLSGGGSINASDQDILQKAKRYANDKNFQDAYRDAVQASANLSHNLTDEKSKRLAESISGSYEKAMHERYEASKSYAEAESYNEQAMNMRTNAASFNANYNQPFFEWLVEQPADNATGHIGRRGAADIMSRRPKEAMEWQNKFMAEHGLLPQRPLPTNPSKIKEGYETEEGHKKYTASKDALNAVKQKGMAAFPQNFSEKLSERGDDLRDETSSSMKVYGRRIAEGYLDVSGQGSEIKQNVEDQEGQSVFVRALGKLGSELSETIFGPDIYKIREHKKLQQQEAQEEAAMLEEHAGFLKSPPPKPFKPKPGGKIESLFDSEAYKKMQEGEPQQK
jgi:conjugal transfer mating pair stabilization protein TraG